MTYRDNDIRVKNHSEKTLDVFTNEKYEHW